MEPSISINIWSYSEQNSLMQDLITHAKGPANVIKQSNLKDAQHISTALKEFTVAFLDQLYGEGHTQQCIWVLDELSSTYYDIKRLLDTRYSHLFLSNELQTAKQFQPFCVPSSSLRKSIFWEFLVITWKL